MKYFARLPALLMMLILAQPLAAGPGHDHSHDHGHHHGPISSAQAVEKATEHVKRLAERGKIDASWSGVSSASVEEKSFGHGPEWVVTFQNQSITDPEKKTLYVFYTIEGKYLASNYTGQ